LSHFRALFLFCCGFVSGCSAFAQHVTLDAPVHSPHGTALKISCQECHTTQGWKPLRAKLEFNHSRTKFPLRGRHTEVQCADCHQNLVFSNAPMKCQNCHADLHRRKNGAECELCHNTNGWQVSIHNINEHQDRFPLIGAHAAVDCYSCHKVGTVGQFNRFGLSTECVSCHLTEFRKTTAPNHKALGFPTDCQQCHLSMDTWYGAVQVRGAIGK
jgi:ribosomal protein S27E